MTDEFDLYDDMHVIALERAISAAENAVQAAAQLWEMLTLAERDAWLANAATTWPRRDVALKTLLPASDKLLAEMRAADS